MVRVLSTTKGGGFRTLRVQAPESSTFQIGDAVDTSLTCTAVAPRVAEGPYRYDVKYTVSCSEPNSVGTGRRRLFTTVHDGGWEYTVTSDLGALPNPSK